MGIERDCVMLVVTDFEATCWDREQMDSTEYAKRLSRQEIIEIGCMFLDVKTLEVVHKMSLMVKPVFYGVSGFCTNLTGITSSMADRGAEFEDALSSWGSLIYSGDIFASWGLFDDRLLRKNCEMHELGYPFDISAHLNLKQLVAEEMFNGVQVGVKARCHELGLDFVGQHHRGLDDVENIVRIVKKMCNRLDKDFDVILRNKGYNV